jgi:hypothetical protein
VIKKNVQKSQDGGHFRFGYILESLPNSEKVLKTKIVPNDKMCSKTCSKNPRWRLLLVWLYLGIFAEWRKSFETKSVPNDKVGLKND